MPLLPDSSFRPATGLGNGHLQTVWPALFRKPPLITTHRERLELADGDFLDLDWARQKVSRKLVIITHGLESSSRDSTIQGMAAVFFSQGWDVLAWNLRGCSGEMNRLARFYHSGVTEDLAAVIEHGIVGYEEVASVGFSLGGNILLKYLGETDHPRISAAVAFSVPCDLTSSVDELDRPANSLYTRRFIKSLRDKVAAKNRLRPGTLDVSHLSEIRNFHDFDSAYTAPLHGFASAEDYWEKASCLGHLSQINVPTLLVSAADDPFLSPACFPREIARASKYFHLEIPAGGGHCGFVSSVTDDVFWHETRTMEFLASVRAKPLPRD